MPARNSSSRLTTPSALSKVASRNFITRAATPPVPGGEHPRLMTFAHPKNLFKKTKFYPLCLCVLHAVIARCHSSIHPGRNRRGIGRRAECIDREHRCVAQ